MDSIFGKISSLEPEAPKIEEVPWQHALQPGQAGMQCPPLSSGTSLFSGASDLGKDCHCNQWKVIWWPTGSTDATNRSYHAWQTTTVNSMFVAAYLRWLLLFLLILLLLLLLIIRRRIRIILLLTRRLLLQLLLLITTTTATTTTGKLYVKKTTLLFQGLGTFLTEQVE